MSTDQNHSTDELFTTAAIDENEGGTDGASTTPEEGAEESKALEAEKKRDEMRKAWTAKVLADPSKMDELKTKQPWLADKVAADIQSLKEDTAKDQEAKLTALARKEAEKLIKERDEQREFESLKGRLNEVGTTTAQRETITKESKELQEAGLSPAKALEKACRIANVDLSNERLRRRSMSLPDMAGAPTKEDDVTSKVMRQAELDPEEIRKLAIAKSQMYKGVKLRSIN